MSEEFNNEIELTRDEFIELLVADARAFKCPTDDDRLPFRLWFKFFSEASQRTHFAFMKPEEEHNRDTHTEHCCVHHGCKYSDESCTVVKGKKGQSGPCEWCNEDMW